MQSEPDFSVGRRRLGDATVVVPDGDVDLSTVDAVREQLHAAAAESSHVVVDLRAVRFMDSSGLRLLVEVSRRLEDDGADLTVVRGPAAVERLFELSGLAGRLRVVERLDEVEGGAEPR